MMLLSDKLINIRDNTTGVVREKLTVCIQQALVMEERIANVPKQRHTDPDTSYFDGTNDSLRHIQKGVLHAFEVNHPHPLDELTMNRQYTILEKYTEWMRYVDPEKQDGTLRKRRSELEDLGLLVLVDKEGESRTGQRAARYRLTQAGLEACE